MKKLKFIDICAGIGGGRLGLEESGFECVGHSEIDKIASEVYAIFHNDENNYGDLTKINISDIPEYDILIGGFPCQTFSIVGKREGLDDDRGQIIYGILKILENTKPKYFILENVKGLINHNKGSSIKIIIDELKNIGYNVEYKVLDSKNFGTPQMRERVYIVGVNKKIKSKKILWSNEKSEVKVKDFLDDSNENNLDIKNKTFQKYLNNKYNVGKYNIEEILKTDYLILDTRQSDLRIYENRVPTLRAGRHGILYTRKGKLKKLSGKEGLRLQGFPEHIIKKIDSVKLSETKILSLVGNAMTVNVINEIGKSIESIEKDRENIIDKSECETIKKLAIKRGSKTARDGFKNEKDIVKKFNNWNNDEEAKEWLKIMKYKLEDIECVEANILSRCKADINVQIKIKLKKCVDVENIQVKLVSNKRGYNQIDKRWLKTYKEMWEMPEGVYDTLKYFTGELEPKIESPKYNKRMLMTEFDIKEQKDVLSWISSKKTLIVSDILRGRGKFSAEWLLVVQKTEMDSRWILKNINEVMQYYLEGEIEISKKGSLKLGKITIQRKGGDNGRDTAKMLQFKMNPIKLFDIDEKTQ